MSHGYPLHSLICRQTRQTYFSVFFPAAQPPQSPLPARSPASRSQDDSLERVLVPQQNPQTQTLDRTHLTTRSPNCCHSFQCRPFIGLGSCCSVQRPFLRSSRVTSLSTLQSCRNRQRSTQCVLIDLTGLTSICQLIVRQRLRRRTSESTRRDTSAPCVPNEPAAASSPCNYENKSDHLDQAPTRVLCFARTGSAAESSSQTHTHVAIMFCILWLTLTWSLVAAKCLPVPPSSSSAASTVASAAPDATSSPIVASDANAADRVALMRPLRVVSDDILRQFNLSKDSVAEAQSRLKHRQTSQTSANWPRSGHHGHHHPPRAPLNATMMAVMSQQRMSRER